MKARIHAGALGACLVSLATLAHAQAPVESGADWLLTQQFPSGAYPWTVGSATAEPKTQGTTARGMLSAFDLLNDPAYLDSAVRTGDFLVDSYPRSFTDGDPDIFPLDPLFLEELTHLTGDTRYSDFVETNLWSKLTAGTYGEANDQNAAAWAAAIPTFPEYPWNSLTPVFRASPAIAAHYTGHTAIRDALMASVLTRLNLTTGTNNLARRGDLTALAAAVWASAHTGINLDPTAGRWTSAANTQGLVNSLLGYQRVGGDWPSDTTGAAAAAVGDVSVTTWAVWALKAWNPTTYATQIASATSFIQAQQQGSGQIMAGPGYPSNTVTGVEVHGEALVALASDDGALLDDVPTVSIVGATTVIPGGTVQVKVEHGPGLPLDWVGLYSTAAVSEFSPLDWKYLDDTRTIPTQGKRTATVTLRMPYQPGPYHVRLFRDRGFNNRIATSASVTVVSVKLTALGPSTVNGGTPVQVSVAQGTGNATDWVGLYASGASETAFVSWQYLNGTQAAPVTGLTSATLTFIMPNAPGTYEFRFFPSGSYHRLATSTTVTVATSPVTLTVLGPTSVNGGSTVQVAFDQGPGNVTDWVGLYASGASNTARLSWQYLNGTRTAPPTGITSGTLSFVMPNTPGTYNFRFFPLDSFVPLVTSATVTVVSPTVTITPLVAGPVSPGASVQVSVASGPGNPLDWVGLHLVGGPDKPPLDWKFLNGTRTPPVAGVVSATLTFTMPASPGNYEFRIFSNGSYYRLATSSSVVVQ